MYVAAFPSAPQMLVQAISSGGTVYPYGINYDDISGQVCARIGSDYGTYGTMPTGQWVLVDMKLVIGNPTTTLDMQINGVAFGQAVRTAVPEIATLVGITLGTNSGAALDLYFDDVLQSHTAADYPLGAGKVEHFIPTADGTHNIAGTADFRRSATTTDILNSTTTAYQLIDDVPMKSGTVAEYINLIAPPNATDYVEVMFGPAPGISTPAAAPRAVEAVISKAKGTGTGTNNLRIALNDNGTTSDIFNGDTTTASPTATFAKAHFNDPPSAATAWTVTAGNGNFNNVRMRCYTSDAAPDPWWASAMIEAEFATGGAPPAAADILDPMGMMGIFGQ
jgi:hypothetical protein